jgi:hypothetical protein
LTGWPSELSSFSGGDGSCGWATLPRNFGFAGSGLDELLPELEDLLPQAARQSAAAAPAMAIAMGTHLGRIRTFIPVPRLQSSVKTGPCRLPWVYGSGRRGVHAIIPAVE